jgi:putative colanic acid biosynthesis acetyltransferase WcaF
VAADVFVGPGVMIGEGAVVGARASVFRNVDPWTVVGGNPARIIKKYEPQQEEP